MSDLKDLTRKIKKFRDERNWKQFHSPKDVAISLVLEASEVLEHFQWKNEEEIKTHLKESRVEIGEELADVFYWVLLMCEDFGIDIKEALDKKLKKNEEKYPIEKAKDKHTKYTKL